MSVESRRAVTTLRTPPFQPSVDREREQQREEQLKRDLERIAQDAAAQVSEQLSQDRAVLAEQQGFLLLQNMILEASRRALPGKLLAPTEANQRLLVDMLNPGETPSVELLTTILRQYANRFSWIASTTPAERRAAEAAEYEHDRATFLAACREIGMSTCDANWSIVRGTLGSGFDQYQLKQAVQSGAVRVTGATDSEAEAWRAEAAQRRVNFLQNTDLPTLRRAANQEAQQARAASVQAQAESDYQQRVQRDANLGYKPMPDVWRGEKLDKDFILSRKKCPPDVMRQLVKMFGAAQVEARIRGN